MNTPKSRPVVITFSILAGLQVITGAAGFTEALPQPYAGLIVSAIAAVQVGMTFYVQNRVVPEEDVAAYRDAKGRTVAGPASPETVLDKTEVEVVAPPEAA